MPERHVLNKDNPFIISITATDPDGDAISFIATIAYGNGISENIVLDATRGSGMYEGTKTIVSMSLHLLAHLA